jgi:hypothetical protein
MPARLHFFGQVWRQGNSTRAGAADKPAATVAPIVSQNRKIAQYQFFAAKLMTAPSHN